MMIERQYQKVVQQRCVRVNWLRLEFHPWRFGAFPFGLTNVDVFTVQPLRFTLLLGARDFLLPRHMSRLYGVGTGGIVMFGLLVFYGVETPPLWHSAGLCQVSFGARPVWCVCLTTPNHTRTFSSWSQIKWTLALLSPSVLFFSFSF